MRAYLNTTKWVKFGRISDITFIAKEAVAYASGCFIVFQNLNTGEELVHTANARCVNGDGIRLLTGHKSSHVFAYAEDCLKPALYVKTYPAMEVIFKFADGPAEGYSALDFSETSYLVALGDLPNFAINVWNWREKERIVDLPKSPILLENQLLKCSWSKPVFMLQLAKGTNKLLIWDVFTSCKKTVLAKHVVKVPKIKNLAPFSKALWTTEGTVMIVDAKGSVYIIDSEFTIERVIEVDIEGSNSTDIDWFKMGIVVSGPNNEIRHYRKSGAWNCDWYIRLDFGLKEMISNKLEYLVGVTTDDEVVKINNEGVTYMKRNENHFSDFGLVYPMAIHIVAVRSDKFLTVYETETGNMVGEYVAKMTIMAMAENPDFPYVALGYDNGHVELISIYKPDQPSLMTSFHLCSQPMHSLKFFEQGRVLVAAFLDSGKFFVITGIPGTQMTVVAHVDAKCQIVDYMMVSSSHCHRLFVIPVTTSYLAGNKIVRYCIISKENMNVKEYVLESEDFSYHRLIPMTNSNRDRMFYALPFAAKSIHVLETRRGDSLAKLTEKIKTGHQLNKFEFRLTSNFATTWGYEGFIIVRSGDFGENIALGLQHHRYQGGVQKAYIDPMGQFLISLGRENVLACAKIAERDADEDLRSELNFFVDSPKFALMFKRPTMGFQPEGRFKGLSWIEVESILKTEEEEMRCRQEKSDILKQFHEIKTVLVDLVDKNLTGPENEKIDLLEFYLDTGAYNQKKVQNKEDCKNTEVYLKALIQAQDKVSNHLMTNYVNAMGVPGKIIRGFFTNTLTQSFTLLAPKAYNLSELAWIEERRKIEQILSLNDTFEPYNTVINREAFQKLVQQPMKLATQDYTRIDAKTLMEESMVSQDNVDSQIALVGSVTQLFVDKSLGHYKQWQLTTFYQCLMQDIIAKQENYKLKLKYNDSFDSLMEHKYREFDSIKEKNARLRHIISEFNYFSKDKIYLDIVDPEWTQEEQPCLITKVSDSELTTTPYISPAEQAILDAKAAEEERIRLALLADDFRERALMAMMNGVLEIRWEDELKKEVPLPKCMIDKDPAQYTEEDLRAVKDYEEKVVFLNSERERYKNILDVDFNKTATAVRDTIRRFNLKLKDNVDFKMLISSGMNQEYLKSNRARITESERVQLYAKENELLKAIRENDLVIEQLQQSVEDMKEQLNACKTSLENLASKEKLLDKAFKRDFQEVSPIVQEQALKLYKRRPKANYRQINIVSVLFELAKCIITQEKSLVLTNDCIEYIKALDVLDQYAGLPPTVDENTYSLICKHRRLRLEYEIKLRATQTQITDGEASIATFMKRISMKREKNARLSQEISKIRAEYQYLMHNVQVQMVLRRGIVEIPLTGDIKDFEDAILVPKQEIEEINGKIKEAGNKKLHTIMQNMSFRRNIMMKEWEHQKMRMEINDLIEQIKDIEDVKFSIEMQRYLKGKHMGRKTDNDSFERELEVLITTYENYIKSKKDKWLKITKQIETYKAHTKALNKQIKNIHIDVCHLNLQQDADLHIKENEMVKVRMEDLLKRSSMVQQIQQNQNEILVLQTELELLRLRTYPTFKYKLINQDD